MSGSNPFRRSKIIAGAETFPAIPNDSTIAKNTTAQPAAYEEYTVQSTPHQKTVRIASPPVPLSPAETHSYFPPLHPAALVTHRGSPPPQDYESVSSDDSESDPFNPEPSDSHRDGVDEASTRSDNNAREGSVASEGSSSSASQSVITTVPKQSLDRGVGPNTKVNATLDVDAFTRLLLTGNAEDVPAQKKADATAGRTHSLDHSAHADTSFEPANKGGGANTPESPRQPRFESASSTTRSSVDEVRPESKGKRADTVQRASGEKKSKPPPPKTRHGKLIKPDQAAQPSTVSGEEVTASSIFSHSAPSDTSIPLSPESHHSLSTPPLTKASPLTSDDAGSMDDASSLHRHPSQLKTPPTPPLTRRHSQMKPSRKASSRDQPQRISMPPGALGFQIPGATSPGTKTPPRPPSRRYDKSMNTHPADSLYQPKSPLSQDHSISSNTLSSDSSASLTSSPPSRASSVKRSASGSTAGAQLVPPPPPPPRRIRASSKGSNSSAQPTGSQPEQPAVLPQSSNAEDILADLTRLQREVDDLRGHYQKRKVSE